MTKTLKILPLFITFTLTSIAQIVTTNPDYPTQNDSIVVFFDATQPGASELLNYTGDVYAHTGVITNLGGAVWQHVIAPWESNIAKAALVRISPNYYKFTIGFPRQFYNVTNSAEKILKLALVFRSSDRSKQTRPDIFIDIYEPGLTLEIENPAVSVIYSDPLRSPSFVKFGETVPVTVNAVELGTKVSTLTLYVDGSQVAQTNTNNLIYNFVHSDFSAGAHSIKVVGIDTTGSIDSTSFVIFANPANNNSVLPNGLRHGINYTGPTTAVLALFAPLKDFVYVIGDFNDWKVKTDYMMNREFVNPDSVIWWLEINSLSPGTEYAFQYLVDGSLRIGDPFSEKVLDPWNDQYIPSVNHPALKPYPNGKTGEIVSVLQTAQSEYQWQVNDFQKPPKEKLVVYELLVRDFSSQQTYQFLIDTLSYLKSLGVNAIELMPVNEFEGNNSWGYNPSFHGALDKYYGTKNSLKAFIDKAHQNGIAVLLDVVLNHAFGQNPLVRMYFDGYYSIGGNSGIRTTVNNPYFNVTSPNTSFFWGADFNHAKPATKYYLDRMNRYWLEEFRFDGFRFDFTKGFTNTAGDGWAYDLSRINILKRMADKIWEFDSTAYVILEHLTDNGEEIVLSNYGMMLWGNMNSSYNEATMGYHDLNKSNFSGISYKNRGWSKPHLVGYMESHDEERLMYKNLRFGNSSGDYNVKFLGEALNRMKMAAAFFLTVPGPKMIWQFGELGYDYSINYDPGINGVPEPYGTAGKDYARTYPKPVRWDYRTDPRRSKLYKVFQNLITLKTDYDAFSTDNFTLDVSGTVKKMNLYHPTMDVFIIGNFGVTPLNPSGNFSRTGWWYDYFAGDSIEVSALNSPVPLPPGEFRIYTSSPLPVPEPGILLEVDKDQTAIATDFRLHQNYPNPFNPVTKISWQSPVGSRQTLKVYDMLGNEVATLVDEYKPAGRYEVEFQSAVGSRQLASGVYFYRLAADNPSTGSGQVFVQTRKMILLR